MRYLVYVHGICAHPPGYSRPWWDALRPHVKSIPEDNRREVLWSDIPSSAPYPMPETQPHTETILDLLHDRIHRDAAAFMGSLGNWTARVPSAECVNDFVRYLLDGSVRGAVLERFHQVVGPLLEQGDQVVVISHSWGTVVAYEGLRQLDDWRYTKGRVPVLFSVGSALAIPTVRRKLLAIAADGRKPNLVKCWVNLNAAFDPVGGHMMARPYAVDYEYLALQPAGCLTQRPFPAPECAHSSYFQLANLAVNRDIFAHHIEGS